MTEMPPTVEEAEPARWVPTRAFGRAVLLVGLLLLVAVFTQRPDLVVIAAPIAIGAAIGLWRRPHARPSVRLSDRRSNVAGDRFAVRTASTS